MTKIIVGFTGPIASGKDASKKYLEEKYRGKSFRFSTVMREILSRLSLEINRKNLSDVSRCLRETFGEDLFAKTMAKDVMADPANVIIVDGIRRLADIAYLKDVPGFNLISIDADPKIRHARLINRGENADDSRKTFEQFLADHQLETELSIPAVMAEANFKINNDGNFDDLHRQIDEIINTIKK
jgi:dephospho-CoA kinase